MTLLGITLKHMRQEKAWQSEHDPNAPKEGDFAPDFELLAIDGITPFHLSDYRGKKPVALVFGSIS